MREVRCAQCDTITLKSNGEVNRAKKGGYQLYCGRKCAGLAKRLHRTVAEQKERKRLYDIEYRRENRARLKAQKAAHYQRTRNPEKERIARKAKMAQHVEYCRQPAYKAWKRDYDRRYRARKKFGPFWESHLLLLDLKDEIDARATRYEVYMENGTINKALERKRRYEKSLG